MKKVTLAIIVMSLFPVLCSAATLPTPGQPFYFVFDYLVNYMIKGPIGHICAVLCVAWGARQLIHINYAPQVAPYWGVSPSVPMSFAFYWVLAAAILKADTLILSLGAII